MSDAAPRVLLVHNEDGEAAEIQAFLETKIGCKTSVTWSGLEALRLLRGDRFDVLLLDDYVPDLYIGDLIERTSALPLRPQILVLADDSAAEAVRYYRNLGICTTVARKQLRAIVQAITAGLVAKRSRLLASARPSAGFPLDQLNSKRPN